MCDTMHFAEEMTGCFREQRQALPAIAIADPSPHHMLLMIMVLRQFSLVM